ncbi:DUF5691 domain-containing protein [Deinococcus radiopugnans]|uniref:DUF5691 domain-containing protein n=1 Tax=Deinococcus radiopugnans TaxID=57497 RepID=UPI00068D087B|nr:DUF5691 domain-containing protein [Deinococcus radiopugnans]
MNDLNVLLAAAMVGTARATLPAPAGTPLAAALNHVTRDDAEATLLARAALAGLATRAGRRPEAAPPLPAPAPAETRPEAPSRVTRHLPHLLDSPVLPEWLTLCAAAGWRVPPAFLPALLDWGSHADEEARAPLRRVLGERGRWLAAFSPDWRWLHAPGQTEAGRMDEATWDAATEAGREALFRTLRADAPDASRAFLLTQLKAERVGVRRRLLAVLDETWTVADGALEPLLEDTLTDRSEDVQGQARRLLQRLPGSAYNARMAARLKAMLGEEKVGWLGRLTGQRNFTLTLPEVPEAELKRDGLEPVKRPATRLRQLMNVTHPGVLLSTLELTPAELVRLAVHFEAERELSGAVHAALSSGAQDDRCAGVADALVPHLRGRGSSHRPHLAQMLGVVSPACRVAELQTALRGHQSSSVLALLQGLPPPWPAHLSGEVLRELVRAIRKAESPYAAYEKHSDWDHAWMGVLTLAQTHAAPDAPRPAPLPADAPEYARQTLNTLYAGLELRAQLHADFAAQERR